MSVFQYYWKNNKCTAVDSGCSDCICWHDEGTGPWNGERHDGEKLFLTWRKQGRVVVVSELPEKESDPTGRAAHDPGAKLDAGKLLLGLVLHGFPRALEAVGAVGTYGATKYSPSGWVEVPDGVSRYTDAMYRHLLREAQGEQVDQESGLLHAAQTAWNALARLELMLRGEQ